VRHRIALKRKTSQARQPQLLRGALCARMAPHSKIKQTTLWRVTLLTCLFAIRQNSRWRAPRAASTAAPAEGAHGGMAGKHTGAAGRNTPHDEAGSEHAAARDWHT